MLKALKAAKVLLQKKSRKRLFSLQKRKKRKMNNNYAAARQMKEKQRDQNLYQSLTEKSVRNWRDDPDLNLELETDGLSRQKI